MLGADLKGVTASGEKGVFELLAATHAGMPIDEFSDIVRGWIASARHPVSQRPYNEMVYQPMLDPSASRK